MSGKKMTPVNLGEVQVERLEVVDKATFTQIYSQASTTLNAMSAEQLTDNTGGTASNTIGAVSDTYTASEHKNIHASLIDEINKLRADILNTAKVLNALIDELQRLGILG